MPSKVLFIFNRDLPTPLNTFSNKKVPVHSMFSDKTEATLTAGVIKAVQAYINMESGDGAVGLCGNKFVAEYKSAEADVYHLAVYVPMTGHFTSTVYNAALETHVTYTVGPKARDGAALFLAMMPQLMEDQEFADHFDLYAGEYKIGITGANMKKAKEHMAILCDNAYRRIMDETCAAHIKTVVDNSGNITRISQAQLDAGNFIPDTLIRGEFKFFDNRGSAAVLATPTLIAHEDFVGKYPLNPSRTLSAAEENLVPRLEPWYVLPKEVVSVCRHALHTTAGSSPMRNFMLRGPAGSGKTMAAQAIAAGLHLPYVKCTCNANTEIFDIVGQVFPDSEMPTTGNAELDKERDALMAMGGITFENIAKLMNLPGVDDMEYDPQSSYLQLTGTHKSNAGYQDCVSALMRIVAEKITQLTAVSKDSGGEQRFRYVESDFIKAIKFGYACELQEPSTIMQPGVLVGLNSLLEQGGSITLPTGELVKRHPDAVIIITTNVDYEGCRQLNQSVTDRMSLIYEIPLPAQEVMAQRALNVTGFEDELLVAKMVNVVDDLDKYCRANGISDGSVGMRGLIDWIQSTQITNDPYESALHTIVTRATPNYDDQIAIRTAVLEPLISAAR